MARGSLIPPITAGIVGAVTGFASSFALVVTGLRAAGADPAQAASGLLALCLAQAVLAMALSWRFRMPLSFAWSTPGAALLITAPASSAGFGGAISAFLLAGLLTLVTGLWPALARLMTRIPAPIASAMLAGVLLPLCLSPVTAVLTLPWLAIPPILVWLLLTRLAPRWAVPAAVAATAVAVVLATTPPPGGLDIAPTLVLTTPAWDPVVLLTVGLPLYIVTMAAQNVAGFRVLTMFGYPHPPARAVLAATGIGTMLGAPLGGHTVNLAAITAAMVAGPDAHPDPQRRWIAAFSGGAAYVVLGLGAGAATTLVAASPPVLIESVAGLALLGALVSAISSALEDAAHRTVAIVTLVVVVACGLGQVPGSAFWGLIVGGLVMLWLRRPHRGESAPPAAR